MISKMREYWTRVCEECGMGYNGKMFLKCPRCGSTEVHVELEYVPLQVHNKGQKLKAEKFDIKDSDVVQIRETEQRKKWGF